MTHLKGPRMEGRSKTQMKFCLSFFSLLVLTLAMAGTVFPQEAEKSSAQEQEAVPASGANEYEGIVKVGLGNYFYMPAAKGFDIYVQGKIEGKDANVLAGKEIKVKGALLKEDPSVFVAESIDLKEAGQFRNVFTRTEPVALKDHLSLLDRQGFAALKITSADKSQEWEGKGKVKIYGALTKVKAPDGKEVDAIALTNDEDKAIGNVLVDTETDFARYYINKLSLFDKFWFYVTVKDTVDAKVRRKTRDLFHADLVFAGLY